MCYPRQIQPEEIEMALIAERKAEIVKEYQIGEGDTGSPEVQVALLTCLLYTSPSPRD